MYNVYICSHVTLTDMPKALEEALSQNSDFREFATDLLKDHRDAAPVVLSKFFNPVVVQVRH